MEYRGAAPKVRTVGTARAQALNPNKMTKRREWSMRLAEEMTTNRPWQH